MTEMLRFVITRNVLPAASVARKDVKGGLSRGNSIKFYVSKERLYAKTDP